MPLTDETDQTDRTRRFAALSTRLTGFDTVDLAATGLVEAYLTVAAGELGAELLGRLLRETPDPAKAPADGEREPDGDADASDDELRSASRALTYLWYTGSWPGRPSRPLSPRSYAEALVWKAAGLTAPAARPGGYGSWAEGSGR
ncbi:hypothetical protein [Streptomyces showdoensis]|uniref:Uncharacterized protein n=1 Tax=Streptomyces showdoensis TaxID=68268 RepID=A0A2P2GU87_STREW|nr:hypothetical protein [Streptomyces showdoensis]KKZ75063.1 hypothetical protein VO63_04475 [Streptomyces showdoensis]